jgi:hypothetical protein
MSRSSITTSALVLLLAVAGLSASSSCIKPPPRDASLATGQVDLSEEVTLVWDGDEHGGKAKEWANCNLKDACKSTVRALPAEGVNGSVGLEWHAEGKDWKGFGWISRSSRI